VTEAKDEPCMVVRVSGGRAARVPLSVLEQYVDPSVVPRHEPTTPQARPPTPVPGQGVIVNIYANGGQVTVATNSSGHSVSSFSGDADDVVAHSLSIDPVTGESVWHTDWEYGDCVVRDDYGFPRVEHALHRHPLGTEYAEILR